jgi:hypothetical protein
MANFYNISINEMRDFLKPEKGWSETIEGKEIAFIYPLKQNNFIQIIVFTGILVNSGFSRGVGKDAIRVSAVDMKNHRGWIKGTRVHRVMGWKDNLKNRVLKVIEQAKARLRDEHKIN